MEVSISTFKIPFNHLLIKPDPDHETMVTKGGLELHVARHKLDPRDGEEDPNKKEDFIAKHFSITGTVITTPERMVYHGYTIKSIKNKAGDRNLTIGELLTIQQLTADSLELDTPCEVKVGDKVWFHYMEHFNAAQQARIIQTKEHGECFLMKYDSLFCYERDGEQFPINGWVWIQQKFYEESEVLSESGIYLSSLEGKPKKNQAIIIKAATPIRDYMDSDTFDGEDELEPGTEIYYNSKHGTPLEHEYHLTKGVPDVIKIRRRHILGIKEEVHGF